MKKIKSLAFFIILSICFSVIFSGWTPVEKSYASGNLSVETIDVATLSADKVITDSTKKYVLCGGNSRDITITIRNDSLVEKTFYVTLSYLYIINDSLSPIIVIEDNGHKTTVNLTIVGTNSLTGSLYGAIALTSSASTPANIVVNFATKNYGSINLIAERGTVSSPAIYIQNNVNASLNLSSHNTKVTGLFVSNSRYDDFDVGINEATKDGKTKCSINLETTDTISRRIDFNMMGHGNQVESVLLPENQTTFSPENIPDADGLTFYGWYKDITLNHKWNPNTDTVTEDMTLYAGWFMPSTEQSKTNHNLPVWAIVLISVSAGVILIANAYVCLYFCAYRLGKLNNKFFNEIYKPFKKTDTVKIEESKSFNKQETKKSKPKKESEKTIEKNKSLNKKPKENSSKNQTQQKKQKSNKK